MSTENAEVPVETTETIDWEQRAKKAEAKIVDMKKSVTPEEPKVEETPKPEGNFMTREDYEAEKFFESNPDMVEYKDKITEYTSKGIWFDKAKLLVEADDETIKNRKVASQTNFTSWDAPESTIYTQEQVSKMPIEQRKQIWGQAKAGKVKIT